MAEVKSNEIIHWSPERKLTITAHAMARAGDVVVTALRDLGWEVEIRLPRGQQFTAGELASACKGSEIAIIGDDQASDAFFRAVGTELKFLIKWGVGTDAIDFGSANRHGVVVKNTPGAFSDEVADLALAYILALARAIMQVDHAVRQGKWKKLTGVSLRGKTLGIVGFGGIGRAIARRALSFGMTIVFADPFVTRSPFRGSAPRPLNQVFGLSDFLVLACPSTPDTVGIVNSASIQLMKNTSYIVNVARGDLVVEADLVAAIQSGHLAGAALDVYESEPLPMDSKLRSLNTVILGAHNGSNTTEGLLRASILAVNLVDEYTSEKNEK